MVLQGDLTLSSNHSAAATTINESGASMENNNSNIIKCILDEDLTFLVASPSFYREIGYTKEGFLFRFTSLRQYLSQHTQWFDILKQALTNASDNGRKNLMTECPLPEKADGLIWFRFNVTLTSASANSRAMFSAVLCRITEPEEDTEPIVGII